MLWKEIHSCARISTGLLLDKRLIWSRWKKGTESQFRILLPKKAALQLCLSGLLWKAQGQKQSGHRPEGEYVAQVSSLQLLNSTPELLCWEAAGVSSVTQMEQPPASPWCCGQQPCLGCSRPHFQFLLPSPRVHRFLNLSQFAPEKLFILEKAMQMISMSSNRWLFQETETRHGIPFLCSLLEQRIPTPATDPSPTQNLQKISVLQKQMMKHHQSVDSVMQINTRPWAYEDSGRSQKNMWVLFPQMSFHK